MERIHELRGSLEEEKRNLMRAVAIVNEERASREEAVAKMERAVSCNAPGCPLTNFLVHTNVTRHGSTQLVRREKGRAIRKGARYERVCETKSECVRALCAVYRGF